MVELPGMVSAPASAKAPPVPVPVPFSVAVSSGAEMVERTSTSGAEVLALLVVSRGGSIVPFGGDSGLMLSTVCSGLGRRAVRAGDGGTMVPWNGAVVRELMTVPVSDDERSREAR